MYDEMMEKLRTLIDPFAYTVWDGMTLARHHVFSAFNYGARKQLSPHDMADDALLAENKEGRVDCNGGMGVGVELKFFEQFKDELKLIPALDCGDHTDFAGIYEDKMARFDVTTCLASKKPANYTRENHWVVVFDVETSSWSFYECDGIDFKQRTVVQGVVK